MVKVIKITGEQVYLYWELIKKSMVVPNQITEDDRENYCTNVFIDLLAGSLVCIALFDTKSGEILAMITLKFQLDYADRKAMNIQTLYATKVISNEQWKFGWTKLIKFAVAEDCQYIIGESINARVWQIFKLLGFTETSRRYNYKL